MKDSGAYTLMYCFAVGGLSALLLTAAGIVTGPRKEANKQAEEVRHVLNVLGVAFQPKAEADVLLRLFKQEVQTRESGDGKTVYAYAGSADGAVPPSVAIPLAGPGLWGPIKGFLALAPDMLTIRGVTFHEQEETPGLGGEIASEWFCKQFKGKHIQDDNGRAGMVIGGPDPRAINAVDAITGATMTCNKVQAILNGAIQRIVQERSGNG